MTGTVEFIQKIRYVEIPDEKGEMQVYAIPETVENIRELVRCKDCKWRGTNACFCKSKDDVKDNWFCSEGQLQLKDNSM